MAKKGKKSKTGSTYQERYKHMRDLGYSPDKARDGAKKGYGAGGCYIATAVYGSYDCPEVWTLRRYRDNRLAKSGLGRAFIRMYYATSPTVVKLFGNTEWFKRMWKGKLDKMVSHLQSEGVEATPYEDPKW